MARSRKSSMIDDTRRARRDRAPADAGAEKSLQEAEQRFKTIFDSTSDGIFLHDPETGRITMCNKSCSQMLGYTVEEFARLHVDDIHPEADLPFIHAQIEGFLKGDEPIRRDIRFKRKDGSVLFADVSPDVVLLDGRRHILVVLKDVTERKRAEELLAESERKYRSLVENIPDVTWTTDRQGRTLFISPNVLDVYGYSADEILGGSGTWLENVHPDDRPRIERAFDELFTRKRKYDAEYRIRRKDGTWIWLHDRSVSSYEKDGQWYADGVFSDITERKRMEEELRRHTEHLEELVAARTRELQESEAGLAAAQRLAHFGSWQWDIDADAASWSEETFRIFGITRGPLQQHREDFLSRIIPEDRQRVDQALADALTGAGDYDLDYRITLPDGQERVIHAQAQVLRSHDGRPVMMHGTVQDITERKRAEEALAESRKKYRGLVERINDWVWEVDADGVYTYSSPRVLELLGYAPEEVVGRTPFDFMPSGEAERVWNAFEPIWLTRKPLELLENTLVRKDGSLVAVETSGMPLFAEDGSFLGYTGIDRDVSSRKQAQEALQESEQRLKRAQEIAHLGSWELDLTNDQLSWSDEVYRIFGLQPQEFGASYEAFLSHVHPDDRDAVDAAYTGSLREGKDAYEIEHRIVRKSTGEIRVVHEKCEHVRDASGRIIRSVGMIHDITDRKRMEESLQFTQFAIDHTADAAFWMTHDGGFFYVNEAACQALGYSREELLTMTVYDIDPAFTESMWFESWRKLKAEKSIVLETVHRARDGRTYPVEIRANYLEFGGRAYDCAFARDITTRKQAEEALRESEQRYRRLVENLKGSHFIYRHDTTGMLTYVSESVTQVLGYTLDEGMPHYSKYFTDHPVNQEAHWHTELTFQGIRQPPYEVNVWHKDGSTRWLEVQEVPVYEDGKVVAVEGVAQDITERKRAEEALRESEERFRTAFEEGTVAMALTAMDSTLLKVNSSFCRMLGFSASELVGRSFTEITHPDDRATNLAGTRRLACGEISSFHMEKRYIRKDGGVIWADMSTASVRDTNGRPLYCVTHVQDITDRKQAEEALRSLNEQLELQVAQRTEALRRTVDRLRQLTLDLSQAEDRERKRIADILHEDVQQTLAAARFHLNLLACGTYSVEESRAIIEQIRQMLREAIERSRSLSHELSPAIYQVELTEILGWLARQMREKHGLTVRMDPHGQVDSRSEPLKAFLYKVAQELLFNIVKHSGVREARICVRRVGPSIYLSVVDQGRGFNPEDLDRGAGFGLLSIRERVGLLGGRMKIRSAPGRGSRILIGVPDQGAATA